MSSMKLGRRVWVLPIAGILAVVLYLYFFIDISETVEAISQANALLCGLALLFVLNGLFFYGVTWEVILRAMSKPLGIWRAFQYACASVFTATMLPMGTLSGESLRAYMAVKDSNGNPGSVVASIISHRSVDMMPFLGNACIGLIFMLTMQQYFSFAVYVVSSVILLVIFTISLVLYLVLRPEKTGGILNGIFRFVGRFYKNSTKLNRLREKAVEELKLFHESIEDLSHKPLSLCAAILSATISVVSDIVAAKLVFQALGADVSLGIIITVYTIAISLQTIPIGLPGMVGPVEVSMITLYSLAGILPAIGAAATLILRSMSLWFEVALGGVMAYWVGINIFKKQPIDAQFPPISVLDR